jgi:hypothetical protein
VPDTDTSTIPPHRSCFHACKLASQKPAGFGLMIKASAKFLCRKEIYTDTQIGTIFPIIFAPANAFIRKNKIKDS